MKTAAVIFPFDLFGSGGAGAGAALIGDELREILADNRRETVPTRARTYSRHVHIEQFAFDTQKSYETWRADGRKAARNVLGNGEFLLWIAGNHLGALPVYDELSASRSETVVIQFDAHLDIHHFADCTSELSHGNFLLHCTGPLPTLINAGHRELLLTPKYIDGYFRQCFSSAELAVDVRSAHEAIAAAAAAANRVFIDIDCDVFDPAFFPGVCEPVPFGIEPRLLLSLLESVPPVKLAGVMISEFHPGRDANDRSLSTLIWLIEYLLLRKYEK
jgi:arginase family enzyme